MAYRDSTTASGASATPAVTVPTGAASGDIAILWATIDATAADFQVADWPTGFTELTEVTLTGDGQSIAVGWKRLTGADSGSYTFGNLGASADWVCQCVLFSGRHATDPPVISADATDSTLSNTPQTPTANGVTAVDGDDLVWICGPDYDSATGFTAWDTVPTNFTSAENTENAWTTGLMAYRNDVAAGATGTVAGQFSHADLAGWAAWLVRVPEAAAGGSDAGWGPLIGLRRNRLV